MVSLRQVRYFIGVAEAGQVSAAAADLSISQSAITLAIRDLEAELGVTLFTRRSTGLTPTREGQRFLSHARNIESAVSDAIASMQSDSIELSGRVRIGVTYTLAGYFLFPALMRFKRAHPAVELDLVEAARSDLEVMILDGNIDLALLLTSNLSQRRRIASDTLHRSQRRLWVSSAHDLLKSDRIRLEDIVEQPYVVLRADEADKSTRRYWSAAKLKPNIVFQTSSLEAVRSMVATGAAITILSDVVYRPWSLDGGRVEARELDAKLPTMDVGLAWKRGKNLNTIELRLREFLAEFDRA